MIQIVFSDYFRHNSFALPGGRARLGSSLFCGGV